MDQLNWPLQSSISAPVTVTSFDDLSAFESAPHDILVMTDGWRPGSKAAILRGGMNAKAVLDVLARSDVAALKIFHIEEKIPQLEDIFVGTIVPEANRLFDQVNIFWRHDQSIYDLIESIAGEYDMLLFGAPLAKSEVLPFYRRIKDIYPGSVTIVRSAATDDEEFDAGDPIFKWVRERTYDAHDFSFPSALRNYKRKLGKKVSVILPALNEEKTVGKVIETALEVKSSGIIDEVILIDSDSTDDTAAIGKSYGIPVYSHSQICSDLGTYRGKGEAMFKSAFVTDADILAWVDTDIENIVPSFFYGLLGPILTYPQIEFVKGYFARPVRVESSGIELGGGRVTEIFARPYINLYLPELSGYIQPLAGTVAIYRHLLEKMYLPTNYGIEIAMLAQAVKQVGLWATCQVNLGEVIHKSKDVIGLSEMAFQILQVLHDMNMSQKGGAGKPCQPMLRRVFSTRGHFEISIKRFNIFWRQFK
ncbi:glucosyl-3-phosphoglycerate synthase [Acetonema longum]|uniref:Glucosyl-3-phosphoglycerate synthase n=1 Tax=Acetonema longum DSM 6540 TaxID=1009370 RepID=F7NIY9_9FIRM|nr:glucosyl-3-phosphoglycerate synthase [Acetonema longum]EGO63986.1 putative glucosyl-3-phosphoglycerate synthase [Acetonema longum DSM 6540]